MMTELIWMAKHAEEIARELAEKEADMRAAAEQYLAEMEAEADDRAA